MSPEQPSVMAEWVQRNGRRVVHVAATRGSVTTEATLTEAEARMLSQQLRALLGEA